MKKSTYQKRKSRFMKFAQVSLIQFLTTDLVTIKVKCTSIVQVVVVVVVRSETGLFWPFLSLRPLFVESEREKERRAFWLKMSATHFVVRPLNGLSLVVNWGLSGPVRNQQPQWPRHIHMQKNELSR